MREGLLERLETEVKAYKRYAENLIKKPKKGKIGAAINLLDMVGVAKKCADQVYEKLWKVSKGNSTDREFQLFIGSEILERELKKTYKELNVARQRQK